MPISYVEAISHLGRIIREDMSFGQYIWKSEMVFSISRNPNSEKVDFCIWKPEDFDYDGFRDYIRMTAEDGDVIGNQSVCSNHQGHIRVSPGEKECYLVRFPFDRRSIVTVRNENHGPQNHADEVMEFYDYTPLRGFTVSYADIKKRCEKNKQFGPAYKMEFADSQIFADFMHCFAIAQGELD